MAFRVFPQMTTSNTASQQGGLRQVQPTVRPSAPATNTSKPTMLASVSTSVSNSNSSTNSITVTTTQSTIQSPMGTLILTTMDGDSSNIPTVINACNSGKSNTTEAPPAEATSSSPATRGVKRPAASAPKPSISKSTLFEHQLKTDQSGALAADCK